MSTFAKKRQLLEGAGFDYSFDRDVYYNRETKKIFSVEFVEDHTVEELDSRIRERPAGDKWRFYFNETPSGSVSRELEGALG